MAATPSLGQSALDSPVNVRRRCDGAVTWGSSQGESIPTRFRQGCYIIVRYLEMGTQTLTDVEGNQRLGRDHFAFSARHRVRWSPQFGLAEMERVIRSFTRSRPVRSPQRKSSSSWMS